MKVASFHLKICLNTVISGLILNRPYEKMKASDRLVQPGFVFSVPELTRNQKGLLIGQGALKTAFRSAKKLFEYFDSLTKDLLNRSEIL